MDCINKPFPSSASSSSLLLLIHFCCRLGAHKRKGEKPNGIVQDFKVIQIISHEKYNKKTMSNDVALLKLDREAKLTRYINFPNSQST